MQLALTIGTVTRQASLLSGEITGKTLRFGYVVQAADTDANGIGVAAGALTGGLLISTASSAAANRNLGSHAFTAAPSHNVDGSTATVPAVSAVSISSSPASGDTYGANEAIELQVGFTVVVQVSGTPQLALGIGGETAQAAYVGGSGSKTLTFQYRVGATDLDDDGISVGGGALTAGGGTIRSGVATNAALGLGSHAFGNDAAHKVNGVATAPTFASILVVSSPASGDTYGAGETIAVQVLFSLPVVVTGTPQLALTIGSATEQADYVRLVGTRTLRFEYAVRPGDRDADGVSVGSGALTLAGGTIRTAGGTNALLPLVAQALNNQLSQVVKVDGSVVPVPSVTSVTISSSPASASTYAGGETISVQVGFSLPVTVTGTPQLALGIGSGTANAAYADGSGTRTLTFSYAPLATDEDTDGISIGAAALSLNGGAIQSSLGADASTGLGTHAITNSGSHKVDGTTTVPVVNSVSITTSPVHAAYGERENISVQVGFSLAVTVTGAPQLGLTIGSTVRQAAYVGGSGTKTLTFHYAVQASDSGDGDGISITATALSLNSGTIQSRSGTTAALNLGSHAINNANGQAVLGTGAVGSPRVLRVNSAPASGTTYAAGEVIEVLVTFGGFPTVDGTPQLELTIGNATRQADFDRVSVSSLYFRYTVQAADLDADGISIGPNALTLNGGRIYSSSLSNFAIGLGDLALTNAVNHKVNGTTTVPTVNALNFAAGPASGNSYGAGETIEVRVGFQIPVTVTGAPYATLGIGSSTKQAAYASGSGTNTLTFHYLVQAADSDPNGITVGASALSLNSGTIQSGTGTNASLALGSHAVTDSDGHRVNGSLATAPSVTGASLTSSPASGDTYGAGEQIDVEVAFDIAVNVTGTPRLALSLGGGTRQAEYSGGSGTKTLTFSYGVQFADRDSDGVGVVASALSLAGGTIQSALGTNAALNLGSHAIATASGHKVDGRTATAATVAGVTITSSPASGDTYGAGETISVRIGYQVGVTVAGTPRLALGIGSQVRQAAYASGSGTNALTFAYTVAAADSDDNGISVGANALSLGGGAIHTGLGTAAALSLGSHAIANGAGHKVSGTATAPVVDAVSITSSPIGTYYRAGDTISVQVGFHIPVTVTGTPQLALGIGASNVQANYAIGNGTRTLTFRYEVQTVDSDGNGASVNALSLNGGTIQSADGHGRGAGAGQPCHLQRRRPLGKRHPVVGRDRRDDHEQPHGQPIHKRRHIRGRRDDPGGSSVWYQSRGFRDAATSAGHRLPGAAGGVQ